MKKKSGHPFTSQNHHSNTNDSINSQVPFTLYVLDILLDLWKKHKYVQNTVFNPIIQHGRQSFCLKDFTM